MLWSLWPSCCCRPLAHLDSQESLRRGRGLIHNGTRARAGGWIEFVGRKGGPTPMPGAFARRVVSGPVLATVLFCRPACHVEHAFRRAVLTISRTTRRVAPGSLHQGSTFSSGPHRSRGQLDATVTEFSTERACQGGWPRSSERSLPTSPAEAFQKWWFGETDPRYALASPPSDRSDAEARRRRSRRTLEGTVCSA